jgi:hypothetical protein
MKHIKDFEGFLNESKTNYSIEDFPVGAIIVYENGEEWKVVEPGMRRSDSRRAPNEITAKPHNAKAKQHNISLPVDLTIDFLNSEGIKEIK